MPEALPHLWSDRDAPEDPVEQLVYASNLLGSDGRITNFGGGNTSLKVTVTDPLTGEPVRVLWVKGSGGDLGTATREGFASLYLDKVLGLERRYRKDGMHEDEIVPLYPQCVFDLNPAPPSIDTPLHAFVPAEAVSHMHPESVIAIAASRDARRLTEEIWGGDLGFLPWKRPGFELGMMLQDLIRENPNIKGAVMESHGLICWADDWRSCYDLTLRLIQYTPPAPGVHAIGVHAIGVHAFGGHASRDAGPFGKRTRPVEIENARPELVDLLPRLRGLVRHDGQRLIAHLDRSEPLLDFLSREGMPHLAALGTSCPDHFLRTKIRPLVLADTKQSAVEAALAEFRRGYGDYYRRCRRDDSPPMRNPNPSVILLPGLGMVSLGKTPAEARITGQFYRNAIEVMRGAEEMSEYVALPEQEAFDIEYWQLEEAKLRRMPPERELSRQVAVVTGAAQGIGKAAAKRLAELGASVVLLDVQRERLNDAVQEVRQAAGSADAAEGFVCDVTDGASLAHAFEEAILAYGGLDLCVVNAGNARRGTVSETSHDEYRFLSDLLMKGYFDTIAEATRVMVRQGTGGSIVVVGSKNGVAVGSGAALYSAAKAFELHLMRTVAVDYARHGIRCNAVNPDAVLQGSGIWSDEWKSQTAAALGIPAEDLQEHYRKRTMLGVTITPEDCAEAIAWLASERRSAKTTGAVIPVDGGVREGFLR
jgi:rhamnulose-1-phosphate aldolase/alcohol dehydrogenase